jgi:spore coat polysaccharide biosynthesis predicted glycosyltransferase SpsG
MQPVQVASPRFLFIPVSGPGGAGEYYRSLAIAAGLRRRWPDCAIRFVLNREAPYAMSAPYPVTLLDDSPTRATTAVNTCIRQERPDVVIFDSSGRMAQYHAARAAGARIVYVSSRPKTRWKGFRWRRMRVLDQHWIAQPRFLGGELTPWQRWKLRLVGRPAVLFLDALHEPLDSAAAAGLMLELGLSPGNFAVLCPGGGGIFEKEIDAASVFLDAARELAATREEALVAVVGSRICEQMQQVAIPPNLRILASLPNGVLLGLIDASVASAVNGGSLLLQSLRQHAPLVATPIAQDQLERVRQCAAAGYVLAASLDPPAIVAALRRLFDEPGLRDALRARAAELALCNGVETAVKAVERLLRQDRRHAVFEQ